MIAPRRDRRGVRCYEVEPPDARSSPRRASTNLAQIAAIRAAVSVPLDLYVEGPDDLGAPVRHYELPEIVRVAAPVHLKFTVRNSGGLYQQYQTTGRFYMINKAVGSYRTES